MMGYGKVRAGCDKMERSRLSYPTLMVVQVVVVVAPRSECVVCSDDGGGTHPELVDFGDDDVDEERRTRTTT